MPAEDEISLNAKSHIIQSDIRDDFRQINIHVQGTGQQPDQSIIGGHDRDDQLNTITVDCPPSRL